MLVDVFGSRQIEEDTESLQDIAAEMAPTRVLSPTAWNKPSTEANHTGNLTQIPSTAVGSQIFKNRCMTVNDNPKSSVSNAERLKLS